MKQFHLILEATQPVSHHDPATAGESNTLLFNRQRQLLPSRHTRTTAPEAIITAGARIATQEMAPSSVADIVGMLDPAAFTAAALVRRFIDLYNGLDGSGVFTGLERYVRLEDRARLAAVRSHNVRRWWDQLCADMHVTIHPGEGDADLLRLIAAAETIADAVLSALERESRSVIAVARMWHDARKMQSEAYAAKRGEVASGESVAIELDWSTVAMSTATRPVDVPAVQGNSLRHQIVRAPGWSHLLRCLGVAGAWPGEGQFPPGVEAIFVNGGNIAAGAKGPQNPYAHAWAIRRHWPLLDLLGGVADSFDLGESRLKVSSWIVCSENARAVRHALGDRLPDDTLDRLSVSAFDMLDEITQTRMATRDGLGQMIYNCEVLQPGTRFVVGLTVDEFTPDLTLGALAAAVETFLEDPRIGGQGRAGMGACAGTIVSDWSTMTKQRHEYEAYLTENHDELIEQMTSGTLGASAKVLS